MEKIPLKNIHIKKKAEMRKIKRNKKLKKQKRIKKQYFSNKSRRIQTYSNQQSQIEVFAPQDFSVTNITDTLTFLQNIDKYLKKIKATTLKVNLDDVIKIDMFAMSFLLSKLNKLKQQHQLIQYWGTYPNNLEAKQFIIDSGFLDIVRTNIKKPEDNKTKNQIINIKIF